MFKNQASQKIALFAFTTATGAPKTGDAANLTAYLSKDYGTVTVLTDTSATEMDATNAPGWYLFDVSQTESNGDELLFTGKSATSGVTVVGRPVTTVPIRFTTLAIDASGLADANTVKVEGADATNTIRDSANAADILQRLVTLLEPAGGSPNEFRLSVDALRNMPTMIWGAERANFATAGTFGQYVPANVTFFGGTAGTFAAGRPEVNTTHAAGTAWNSGAIGAATLATDTITAAKIAADAIGASELAADAVAEIQSGLATSATLALVKAVTDKMDTTLQLASGSPGDYEFSADALRRAPTGSAPSAASIADAVWDEAISGHLTSGTTGASLNAAGSAGDPWSTTLPGAYGAGTAGYIIGSTIKAQADRFLSMVEVASGSPGDYKFTPDALRAVIGIVPTAIENADALLNRDMSAVSDTNARSPLNALRFLRNKWSISGATLTVTKENDSTSAWTATVSTTAGADPVTGNDPA